MTVIRKSVVSFLLFSVVILVFSSCATNRNLAYFKDIGDSTKSMSVPTSKYFPAVIKKDDILNINIQTLEPAVTSQINQQSSSPTAASSGLTGSLSASGMQQGGFLVNNDGEVIIPVIGKIKLAGLTTSEAVKILTDSASKYYKDPTVSVRFSNFRVSVMGEVTRPSVYVFPNERVSLLDAISYAGDLTQYGKRDEVLLIREVDSTGNKEFIRMNLNSTALVSSPFFYLKQNDMIYVPPTKAKEIASDVGLTRTLAIIVPVSTLLVILASKIKF